jgi:Inner membrane protein YgaP-like, transmembrane domain
MIGFLASTNGRMVRVVAGIVLILLGLFVVKDAAGIIIAVIGLVPLLAGVVDFCVFAPLFGKPFSGKAIRNL